MVGCVIKWSTSVYVSLGLVVFVLWWLGCVSMDPIYSNTYTSLSVFTYWHGDVTRVWCYTYLDGEGPNAHGQFSIIP